MDAFSRKDFLKFVTARVRLPSGGLRALSRKVRVAAAPALCAVSLTTVVAPLGTGQIEIRRGQDIACVPHGHTCALSLDLPPYRTQTELHVMLFKALDLMNNYDTGLYD